MNIKNYSLVVLALFLTSNISFSQNRVVISDKDNQSPHESAVLDLISTDKGFLLPRMESNSRNSIDSPAESLLIFNEEKGCVETYVQGEWHEVWCSPEETAGDSFDFLIETTSSQTEYMFVVDGATDFWIDWGDGNTGTYNGDAQPTHDYEEEGFWTISVRGEASRISFYVSGTTCVYAGMLRDILTPISNGVTGITSAFEMFKSITVESFTCEDFFDVVSAGVVNMESMFERAEVFNQYIGDWDVSNVENMRYMFSRARAFNQDISTKTVNEGLSDEYIAWDVRNVETMERMFNAANVFNSYIGDWDVTSVITMQYMFTSANEFNQDITGWDMSNVEVIRAMFWSADAFNQDINSWDISNVTSIGSLFRHADSFNQDLNDWEFSPELTSLTHMFYNAKAFNGDISNWDVSSIDNFTHMFNQAVSFNQDISGWEMGNAEKTLYMFANADSFNQDISGWDVSNVTQSTDMSYMFQNAISFNQDLSEWCVTNISSKPYNFDDGAVSWTEPRPVWGTCP